jgi:hypothetical protein
MATGRVPTTANSPLTAKGDLFTYSTAPARLAVGNDGEQIVADSSTSTGLRYQGSIAGGKNFVINGGMDIWQRGTSFAVGGVGANFYSVDRWTCYSQGAGTIAQDTSLSASGFRYGVKFTSSSASGGNDFYQLIETDQVIPLAGKQVALSGYALSVNGKTPAMNLEYSTTVNDGLFGTYVQCTKTTISEPTATGSLLRYTYSFAVPTTAKTLRLRASTGSLNNTEATIWTGVQLELGNVPTAFSRAGGTIQGELAAAQRYYQRWTTANGGSSVAYIQPVFVYTGTQIFGVYKLTTTMRGAPVLETTGTASNYRCIVGGGNYVMTGVPTIDQGNPDTVMLLYPYSTGGLTVGQAGVAGINTSSSSYLGFSAEL